MRQILLILLLTGCSTFTAKPYQERLTESTVVTWITVDNVHETCVMMGIKILAHFKISKDVQDTMQNPVG